MKNIVLSFIFGLISLMTFSQTPVDIYVITTNNCPYSLQDTWASPSGAGNMTLTSIDSMGFQNVHHYFINDTVYPITLTVCLYVGASQAPFPPQTPQCMTQTLNSGVALTFVADCSILDINEITVDSKQLIRVIDLMGKEVSVQPNKPLIYEYSDGSKEMWYISH